MFFRRPRTQPQRAGTAPQRPADADDQHVVVDPQGQPVTLSAHRHALWLLLDGQRDVSVLAQALGWPEAQVWSELDALADEGLLLQRVAPPAGGPLISRRHLLRGGVPALALAMPAVAMAQDAQEQFGKITQETSNKLAQAEVSNKQMAEQAGKFNPGAQAEAAAKSFQESLNKSSSAGEQAQKEQSNKSFLDAVEQSNKQQEVQVKIGTGGPTHAVPEPGTLALVGLAGAAVYLQQHWRERADRQAEPAKSDEPEAR